MSTTSRWKIRLRRGSPMLPARSPSTSRARNDARQRMKNLVGDSLEALQAAASIASDIGGDLGVPGLKPGLSALAEVLKRIQTMKATVEGVDTLHEHIVSLSRIIINFHSRTRLRPLSDEIKQRMERLSCKWVNIAERAKNIKGRWAIKRLFSAEADVKKLEALVEEINNSIQQDFMLHGLLNIEEGVDDLRQDVAVIRQDVEVVHEDVAAVREEIIVVHEETAVVRENVEVVLEGVGAVRQNVEVVLEGVDGVRDNVEAVHGNVEAVRTDIGVVREGVGAVHQDVRVVGKDVKEIKTHLDETFMPKVAKRAKYDAKSLQRACLEGTRLALLNELRDWIADACSHMREGEARNIVWINGAEGTGKTALALAVAQWCQEKGLLGASFFSARDDSECSDPDRVFSTISRQLCDFSAPFRERVAATLEENSDILPSGASEQFEQLILRPLEDLGGNFPPCVVVIDALDECTSGLPTSPVLSTIAKFMPRIARFLVFVVTSRPDQRVASVLENSEEGTLKDATTSLVLKVLKLETAVDKARNYLEDKYDEIRRILDGEELPPGSSRDMRRLADISTGLLHLAKAKRMM